MEYIEYKSNYNSRVDELYRFNLVENSINFTSENIEYKDREFKHDVDLFIKTKNATELYGVGIEILVSILSRIEYKDETNTALSTLSDRLCELLEDFTIKELDDMRTWDVLELLI